MNRAAAGTHISLGIFLRRRIEGRFTRIVPLALTATLLLSGFASAQSRPREPHTFLKKDAGFSDEEIRAAERGEAVSKLLETPLRREVAVLGIVRLEVPIDFFLEKYEDIETFEKGSGTPQIKKLSDPPRPEDFAEGGYPVDSGSPNILWFGNLLGFMSWVDDHLVSRGGQGYRLLD